MLALVKTAPGPGLVLTTVPDPSLISWIDCPASWALLAKMVWFPIWQSCAMCT